MSLGLWDVHIAVFNRLATDSTLAALGVTVYDNVPPSPAMPYVRVGEESLVDDGGKDYDAVSRIIGIHAFSNYSGSKEVKDVMSAVDAALHDLPLAVDGQQVVFIRRSMSPIIILEKDAITRHGVVRFRALTVS